MLLDKRSNLPQGVWSSDGRDGPVYAAARAAAVQRQAQDLYVRCRPASQNNTDADELYDSFISESPVIAKLQYWMKITFFFILILFVDSLNRVYRVQLEVMAAHEHAVKGK